MKKALSVLLSLLLVCGTFAFSSTAAAADETGSLASYAVTWPATGGGNNRITVHYGYVDDGTFTVFDESVFSNGTPSIAAADTPNYLIYDVKDYDHAYTCLRVTKKQEKRLQPILLFKDGDCRCFNEDAVNANDYLSLYDGENVYVVYTPKPETPAGGTATVYETGGQVKTLADVIVVYDVSGSMRKAMDGGMAEDAAQSRLEIGKGAIRRLANSLLAPEMVNREGQKLNRMALITFSTRAALAQDFTSDPDVFNAAVDAAEADGGTNWEEALQLAGRLSVDPDRDTVVILISDGDPTLRMTRFHVSDSQLRNDNDLYTLNQYGYYRLYSVFGHGTRDDMGRNYQAALTEASSLVDQGKTLYTVAISDAAPDMALLSQDAGAGEENSFTAQSEEELTAALDEIETRTLADYSWGGDPSQNDPAIVASGYCGAEGDGTNLWWALSDDLTVTVGGTGEMEAFEYNSPWLDAMQELVVKAMGYETMDAAAEAMPIMEETSPEFYQFHAQFNKLFLPMMDQVTLILEEGVTSLSGRGVGPLELSELTLPASMQRIDADHYAGWLTKQTVLGYGVVEGLAVPGYRKGAICPQTQKDAEDGETVGTTCYLLSIYLSEDLADMLEETYPEMTLEERQALEEVVWAYYGSCFGLDATTREDFLNAMAESINDALGTALTLDEMMTVTEVDGQKTLVYSRAFEDAVLARFGYPASAVCNLTSLPGHFQPGSIPIENIGDEFVAAPWFTLYAPAGSATEALALEKGIHFVVLPICPVSNTHTVTEKAELAPTCTTAGREAGWYCEDCGVYLTGGGTIDPINHRNAYAVEETEATETEHGHTAGVYCPDCEALIVGDVIHNHLGTQTVIQPPTEEEEGIVEIVCTVCDEAIRYSASWTGPEPDENGKTEGGFWQQITGYVRGIINWFLRLFKWLK